MAPPPDRLHTIATAALDAIVDAYAAEQPPAALPDRQYVHAGQVAYDCEQVVVTVERGFFGLAHQEQVEVVDCLLMRSAVIAAHVVRCVPVTEEGGDPPPAADLDAAALELTGDTIRVTNALSAAHRAGNLGACKSLAFEGIDIVGPEGGLAAAVVRFRVGLTDG